MSKKVKATYIILFTALLFHPHIITGHILSIPQAFAQSLTTAIIIGLAYLTFLLSQREIKRKEQAKKIAEKELKVSSGRLADSYKYIGQTNRLLPLLKNLTTDLLEQINSSKNGKKNIFNNLLNIAIVSITQTNWGTFRFINTISGQTIKEFNFLNRGSPSKLGIKLSNKLLIISQKQTKPLRMTKNIYFIPSSNKNSSVQCFLVFPKPAVNLQNEYSILQSIVDQAYLFYKYLY